MDIPLHGTGCGNAIVELRFIVYVNIYNNVFISLLNSYLLRPCSVVLVKVFDFIVHLMSARVAK